MVIDRIRNLIKGVNSSPGLDQYSTILNNLSLNLNDNKDDIELIKNSFANRIPGQEEDLSTDGTPNPHTS